MSSRPDQRKPARRGPASRRWLAWVGAACALFHLAAVLHFALVEHVRCADHGEWVHASGHGHEHATAPPSDAPPTSGAGGTQAERSDSPSVGHDHEHCVAHAERRKLFALAPALTVISLELQRLAPSLQVAPPAVSESVSAQETYAFAPKTSPPTASA